MGVPQKIGVKEIKALQKPKANSHKGENGRLLIIGGSVQFHGAPLLAAKVASKFVDLVYFSSVPQNNKLVQKMKSKMAEFITVRRQQLAQYIAKVDVVLIGPGLGTKDKEKELVNGIIKKFPDKRFVLDADVLRILDKNLLNRNCIITPHANEFKKLFGIKASAKTAFEMSKKYKCVIVLKGRKDFVSNAIMQKVNLTGNVGMTKGGTGDVLAGLIAAMASKNDLFLAAAAGVFINGLAGDRLFKKVSYYYNASDLISEIPGVVKWGETR